MINNNKFIQKNIIDSINLIKFMKINNIDEI